MSGGGTNTIEEASSIPPSMLAAYNSVVSQAETNAATPYTNYSGQIVAPLNSTQNAALTGITGTAGASGNAAATPYNTSAASMLTNSQNTINPDNVTSADISQYENPYTQDVVNSTEAEFNNENAIQDQEVEGNSVSSGAFGGDRASVAQALTAGQQQLAEAPTIAGLNSSNYTTALGEANTEQAADIGTQEAQDQLALSGGTAESSLGSNILSEELGGESAELEGGGLEQEETQENLNVPYEEYLAQESYPFETSDYLSNIVEGLGSSAGSTSSTTGAAPSSASEDAGLAIGAAGLGADLYSTGALGALASFLARGGIVGKRRDMTPRRAVGGVMGQQPMLNGGAGVQKLAALKSLLGGSNGLGTSANQNTATGANAMSTGTSGAAPSSNGIMGAGMMNLGTMNSQNGVSGIPGLAAMRKHGGVAAVAPIGHTAPEGQNDINAQIKALSDPKSTKRAVFLARGTPVPNTVPAGVKGVRRAEGTLLSKDHRLLEAFKSAPHLTEGMMAKLLDYPEHKGEALRNGNPLVVRAFDNRGIVYETAVSLEKVERAVETAYRQAPDGHVSITSLSGALRDRFNRKNDTSRRADGGTTTPYASSSAPDSLFSLAPAAPTTPQLGQALTLPTISGPSVPSASLPGGRGAGTGSGNNANAQQMLNQDDSDQGVQGIEQGAQQMLQLSNTIKSSFGSSDDEPNLVTPAASQPSAQAASMSADLGGTDVDLGNTGITFKRGGVVGRYAGGGSIRRLDTGGASNPDYDTETDPIVPPTAAIASQPLPLIIPQPVTPPANAGVAPPQPSAPPTPSPVAANSNGISQGRASNPSGVIAAPAPVNSNSAPAAADLGNHFFSNFARAQTMVESGGDPSAKPAPINGATPSTAYGADQFTDGTWNSSVRQFAPQMAQGQTPNQVLAMRGDPAVSQQMTTDLAKQNAGILTKAGVPVNYTNLSIMHRFGAGTGLALLKAPASASAARIVGPQIVAANPNIKGLSVGDVLSNTATSVGTAAARLPGPHPGQQYAQNIYGNTASDDGSLDIGPGGVDIAQNVSTAPTPTVPQMSKTWAQKLANSPWTALAVAGFDMAAGTSPFAGVNIGRGLAAGANYLQGIQGQERANATTEGALATQGGQLAQGQSNIKLSAATVQQAEQAILSGNYRAWLQTLPPLEAADVQAATGQLAELAFQSAGMGNSVVSPVSIPPSPVNGATGVAPAGPAVPLAPSAGPTGVGGPYGVTGPAAPAGPATPLPAQGSPAPQSFPGPAPSAAPSLSPSSSAVPAAPTQGPTAGWPLPTPSDTVAGPLGQQMPSQEAMRMAAAFKAAGLSDGGYQDRMNAITTQMAPLTQAADSGNLMEQQLSDMSVAANQFLTGPTANARARLLEALTTAASVFEIPVPADIQNATTAAQVLPKVSVFIQSALARMASDPGGAVVMQLAGPGVPTMLNTTAGLQKLTQLYSTMNRRAQSESAFVGNQLQSGASPNLNEAIAAFNTQFPPQQWASWVNPKSVPKGVKASQLRPGFAYEMNGNSAIWTGTGWTGIPGPQSQ